MKQGSTVPVALIACTCVAEVGFFLGPFVVGGIVEKFEVTDGTGGMVFSLEVGAAALAAAAMAFLAHRVPSRPAVVTAIALLLACNVGSALAGSLLMLGLLRILSGVGAGALMSLGNTLIARSPAPHRLYTRLQFTLITAVLMAFVAVPWAVEQAGLGGVFFIMAALCALAGTIAMVRGLGPLPAVSEQRLSGGFLDRPVVLMLASVAALFAAQNGLWAYVERIGDSIGLSLSVITAVLTATTVVSLGGPAIAHWLGERWPIVLTITGAIVVQLIAALVLITSTGLPAYAFGTVVYSAAFMFVIPYVKTVLATMDPSGRAVGAMMAVGMLGTSFGPAAFGVVLDRTGSYASLAFTAGVGFALAITLTVLSASRKLLEAKT